MKRESTLNMLYPPFLFRLMKGLRAVKAAGIPLEVFESFRTFERQEWLYAQGRTREGKIVTKSHAGRSWHNYGAAADLVLFINGQWSWAEEALYVKAAPILESCGLRWLGRDQKRFELVHYELQIDTSIYEIEEIYKKGGLIAVWQKFNERYGDKDLWKF